jgi:nicotinamide-nucleotide amidase
MIEEFVPIAARIAAKLKERGERIAVADGATGGLISASLLAIPGATKFYQGGGVVYSRRGRDVLFALPDEEYTGMRSATPEYALLQARAIRDNFAADWGIAESGSAGGSVHPLGIGSGLSCAAVVGPDASEVRITQTDSDDRLANMAAFTRRALELLGEMLEKDA